MKLRLIRDAVCAADDYLNDSALEMDVPAEITVREFLTRVLNSGYLQYSSSHQCLTAKSSFPFALVLPEQREIVYLVGEDELLANCVSGGKVEFTFAPDRERQNLYDEYRSAKRGA